VGIPLSMIGRGQMRCLIKFSRTLGEKPALFFLLLLHGFDEQCSQTAVIDALGIFAVWLMAHTSGTTCLTSSAMTPNLVVPCR
jgi:hypothetical protein